VLPELDEECIRRVLASADRPTFQEDIAFVGNRTLVRFGDRALGMGLDKIEQEQNVKVRSNTFALLRTRIEGSVPGFAPAPAVVLRVAGLLNDKRQYVSSQAEDLLGSFGAAAAPAVPLLLERFRSSESDRRQSMCRVFGQIGSAAASAADDIIKFMDGASKEVTTDGLWTLSSLRVNRPDIVARFVEAARSGDDATRFTGIRGLAGVASSSPEALSELLKLVKVESNESRVLQSLLEFDVRDPAVDVIMVDMLREPVPLASGPRWKQVETRHYSALQYLHRAGKADEATLRLLAERAADTYPWPDSGTVAPMIVLRDLVGEDRGAYELVERAWRARKRVP
jgi:hypothetical protein